MWLSKPQLTPCLTEPAATIRADRSLIRERSKGNSPEGKIIPHLVLAAHKGKGAASADGTESTVQPAPPLCCVSPLGLFSLRVWMCGVGEEKVARRLSEHLLLF